MAERVDPEIVATLRRSASDLVRHNIRDMESVLAQVVAGAVATVAGADGGGVRGTGRESILPGYATDDTIGELDRMQYDLGHGPNLSAAGDASQGSEGLVVAHDLAAPPDADRWPAFAPAAVRAGYRSILAAQLAVGTAGTCSSLSLYSRTPEVFDEDARAGFGLFAAQASLLLYGAAHAGLLQRAVESRDLIGQAKGILMERWSLDGDQAFRMLVTSSQETNVKLVDVARWLVAEQAGSSPAAGAVVPGR